MLEKHLLSHVEVSVVCTVHDVKLTLCSFKHITLNTYYVTNNLFSYRFMAYEKTFYLDIDECNENTDNTYCQNCSDTIGIATNAAVMI